MKKMIAGICDSLLGVAASLDWLGPLVMRLYFGYFWAETGWGKLQNIDGAIERFGGWGIPYPHILAPFSAGVELTGGVLIMLGLFTRLVSIPMMINMVVAIVTVAAANIHSSDEFFELDEVLYIVIFFWLMIAGPGRASLDTLIAKSLGIGRYKKAL